MDALEEVRPELVEAKSPDADNTPVAEAVSVALPKVREAWDEPVTTESKAVLVGRTAAVPLPATVVGTKVSIMADELEPMIMVPTSVLVWRTVPDSFDTAVVVGRVAVPVGGFKVSIVDAFLEVSTVGGLPVPDGPTETTTVLPAPPRMLDRMLPSPVESVVIGATTDSVGVGEISAVDPIKVVAPVRPTRCVETILEGSAAVVEAVVEISIPVLGAEIPGDNSAVMDGRRESSKEERRVEGPEGVVVGAEDATPVFGPLIPATGSGVGV